MTTYYIDPTYIGTTKNGQFATPYIAYSSVTAPLPGDKILQKAGTTFNGHISPPSGKSGTLGNPITYGVYDATTGAQIATTIGAATIAGIGSALHTFSTGGESYIEIVGFTLANTTPGSFGIRLGSNSSTSTDGNAARYCRSSNQNCYAGLVIYTNLGVIGHTVDYCEFNSNTQFGIAIEGNSLGARVNITNTTCNYNARSGIRNAFGSAIALTGIIAYNTCNFNGVNQATIPYGIGLDLISEKIGLFLYKNTCSNNYVAGIICGSFSGTAVSNNFVGQGNTCLYNGEYGIQVSTGGSFLLIKNTCNYNGANRGHQYGRGIELYGGSTKPVGPGIVCFNETSYNYNFGGTTNAPYGNGTEGVGIGFDDYHKDIQVFGNLVVANEGNGIQFNPNGATGSSKAFGNILIDNFAAPLSRASHWPTYLAGQMCTYTTESGVSINNNTVILTSQAAAPACLYGICENDIATGLGTVVANNLLMGHGVAMRVRNTIFRENNGFFGNGINVQSNAVSATTLTNGTNAQTVDPQLDPLYRPKASQYKRAGVFLGGRDFYGKHFYNTPNIGAIEDHATPAWASVYPKR